MKRLLLFALLISCSLFSITFAQQPISGSFSSGGQTRSYLGAIPNFPQSSLRLVILFCGATETASQMELRGFNDYLGTNTMVIYPEPANATFGFGNTNGVDDFQMVEDLIADVAASYSVNANDICIGGFSNGSIFTYNLVCDFNSSSSSRAYQFKAFAIVSGAMGAGEANIADCPIANELPIIAFHGTQDPVIPYPGGTVPPPVSLMSEGIETTIDFWATGINGCNTTPTITSLPDVAMETPTPSTVDLWEYTCTSSPEMKFYRIDGGLHAWPGGNANIDMAQSRNMDINASELIAAFFDNSGIVSISEAELSSEISVYPNPAHSVLSFETIHEVKQIKVINNMGQTVLANKKTDHNISLNNLTPGSYFLKIETDAGVAMKRFVKN